MTKRVSELTKEEIAKMFPAELSMHNPDLTILFSDERKLILQTLEVVACE